MAVIDITTPARDGPMELKVPSSACGTRLDVATYLPTLCSTSSCQSRPAKEVVKSQSYKSQTPKNLKSKRIER